MSYNKSVGGGKGGINGTIHVAQLHDVPGYASVVDEEDPSKQLKGDKPITNDAQSKYGADDGSLKAKNAKQSKSSLSSSSPDKEYSKDVLRNRSRSHSSLFEGYEFGLRTEPSEVQASTGCSPNVSCSKGNSEFVVSPSNVSQSGVGIGSPTYFDEEVDANSVAAASADAVRKAIEKAQARIKIAKEMMGRGKEAFQANVESKGSWERRREHKRASKLREKDSHEQRLKEYGKLNSTKVGSEVTDIGNHVRHSDNVANRTAGHESREDQTYDRQGGAVKRDETKLSGTITESKEAEAKTLRSRQGISINKVGVSDDCEKLIKRTAELTIENATGNGTILTAARAMPLQEVHDKTLNKLSADEGAHECDSNSNKLESGIQLQHVEREEMEFEVKEEQLDSAKELIGHSDQGEYCGNPEEFHESSSEINLDENQLEEKTVRAEDCVQEENEEKQPESHKAEGYIKSRVISDNEESCGWRIDGKQENEVREGESSERECSWEKYEEKPIEGHEGKDSVRSREVPDTKESITCEKLAGVEEKRERQGESCERDFVHRSEVTYDKQETKEYNGFNFGVDAKQWLDQMKEILHVRINSFLDGKENSRRHESGAVENTSQIEPEGSEDILEETRGMEATREPYDAQDSMVDDNIRIGINIRSESKVQDVANEGKVDHSEELTGTMEVFGDEENKESADITGDDSEDEENEVIIETTNLSFEEKEVLVSDSINLNEGEASNLSTEEEDNSSGNLEDMCGSETSDLTGASLEADGERQVQGAVAVIGFSENDVKSGFTSIKFGFLQSDPYVEEPEETCEMGEHVEGSDARKNKFHGEKGAEILSNKEREAEDVISQGEPETGVSDADRESDNELNVKENQLDVLYERKEERIKLKQETTTDQTTDSNEEDRTATKIANEKETGDCLETMDPERDSFKKRDERERERERKRERETEREREKERLAVERAIREARERAFAEARERAERAAVDKATAEAHQRVIAHAREKLGKASSETLNKPAEKTSAEARLKAERAAVERATAEARERALEKAMSEKLSGASKDNRVRQKSSYVSTPNSAFQSCGMLIKAHVNVNQFNSSRMHSVKAPVIPATIETRILRITVVCTLTSYKLPQFSVSFLLSYD